VTGHSGMGGFIYQSRLEFEIVEGETISSRLIQSVS
jgi:hypothetical protein